MMRLIIPGFQLRNNIRRISTSYELPEYKGGKFTILGLDPGSTNFGISCVEYSKRGSRILANAVLDNPVKGLATGIEEKKNTFLSEIFNWLDNFNCKAIIAERFQSRGLRGNTAEEVTFMIGILSQAFEIKTKLVIASTWKNAFARQHGEKLKEFYKLSRTTPHQLDASLIALFGLSTGFHADIEYSIGNLITKVENSSLTRLKRERKIK